ncbi:hypothetical protein Tco_1373773 [Tanacetum coccineum]
MTASTPRFEVRESSAVASARQPGLDVTHATDYGLVDIVDATLGRPLTREVGYEITDVWDDMVGDMEETIPTTLEAVNQRVTDLATTLAQDTHELYVRYEDPQDNRALLRAQVSLLTRDRRYFRLMASSYEREKMPPKRTTTPMTDAAIKVLIALGVATALAEYEANKGSGNGEDSHDSRNGRRTKRAARECTYIDFLKWQPLNFKVGNPVKFTTCTILGNALTWWNSHIKTVGHNAAYGMPWKTLMKMITDKYCPRGEIKKLEIEIWNLKVKGANVGSVIASKPKTIQDAIEFATELMDQKIHTFSDRQAKNKKKLDDNSRSNQNQQQPFKKQNVDRAYTAGPGEKKVYGGSKPLCPKCNYHHEGQCAPRCNNCKKVSHLARDYRSPAANANANNQRNSMIN